MKNSRYLWKRICAFLLCTIICMSATVPANADSNKTLRVAFYPLEGFFEYEAGYGVDLLNMISRYSGLHFTYVPADSWESTKHMLLDGEADIRMPGTLPTSPSTTLGYTQHSIMDTYYAVLTLKDRTDLFYDDFDALGTLKYGISQNLYDTSPLSIQLAEANISTDNLVFYNGYNECRAALDSGKVDAVISNIMDMDSDMKSLARFSTVSNHISMAIGNHYLAVINDALAEIVLDEPIFLSELYKKWFPERINVPLTKEETDYLATLDSLQFSFRDGQGYFSRQEDDGTFVGFYPSVSKLICEKLGVKYEQIDITNKDVKGAFIYPDFYYDYVWANECNADMTRSYITINYYELTRKGSKLDPNDCQVAAVQAFRVTRDYVSDSYQDSQMVWCNDYRECIEAVRSGKADVTYLNSYTAEYYLNLYRYSNLSAKLTEYSHQACFAVQRDNTGLLSSILDKTLTSITHDELDALMIESTSYKPNQNLLIEWIYQNPLRSVLFASTMVAFFVALIALIIFVNRIRRKNSALLHATNAKQDFLSRMSHDMRTPMNAIIGFSNFGMESQTLSESNDYHRKIYKAGQYLLQLINDSLDLSKLEIGRYELHPEPYQNTDFIETITNILSPKANEKGVKFEIQCDQSQPETVLFDKIRLQQIFVNLLNNAIKFTPMGGHVVLHISTKPVDDDILFVCFRVTDDGIGMTKEFQKERLFKPFEQEHPNSIEVGTGLGLSIVKELVETMGGTITCESAPGKGTTFTVVLKSKLVNNTVAMDCHTTSGPTEIAGKRILLCEDHPVNREIAIRLLQKADIIVETAENGQIAVDLFQKSIEGYYSAILMDIRMPVMDGLQATKIIRAMARPDAATVPIIAISANAFDEDMRYSLDAGMSAHLAKPIDPAQLYKTLAAQIR